ncbi:hypothetical protein [Nostoc commune]|nr:hypothetical protein [Nostoc commune]
MRESIDTKIANYQGGAIQLTVNSMPTGWVQKQWSYYPRAYQQ